MIYTLRMMGLCCALLLSLTLWSQEEPEWVRIQPFDFIEGVLDIHINEAGTGYLVGNRGFIYKTTDNGVSWELQESGQENDINRIEVLPGTNGQVAFALGVPIISTIDGGSNWSEYDADGLPNSIKELLLTNETNWLAAGNNSRLYQTSDGGTSWTDLTDAFGLESGNRIDAVDPQHAWFLSNAGTLYKTNNWGASWSVVANTDYSTSAFLDFVSPTIGFIIDEKEIYRTEDGGANWSLVSDDALPGGMFEFSVIDENRMVGTRGIQTQYSSDGGQTFQQVDNYPPLTAWECIHALPSGKIWTGSSYLNVGYSENGLEWEELFPGERSNLSAISIHESGYGIIVGNNGINYRTEDFGYTWDTIPDFQGTYYKAQWVTEDLVWLNTYGGIFRSTDGGLNFENNLTIPGSFFSDFDILDENTAWLVTNKGELAITNDQGATWTETTLDGNPDMRGIRHFDENTVLISGADGLILRSTDNGANWTTVDSPSSLILGEIEVVDENRAFILPVQSSQNILYTQDAGASWEAIELPVANFWAQLDFSNPDQYYLAGGSYGGYLLRSEDQGMTWEIELNEITAYTGVQTIYNTHTEQDIIWLIGRGNSIQYKDYFIEEEPNSVAQPLEQTCLIYPNPGADILQIKHSSPESTYRVVDAQGRLWSFGQMESDERTITTGQWPRGIYWVQVQGPDGIWTERWVKE